mmetsp:Transcript_120798/g.385664  ORF Transcript_120798/g.385664 Transcript_120798/m.385664 type:complete len:416 (+) Transcript_120798:265-1512(+)
MQQGCRKPSIGQFLGANAGTSPSPTYTWKDFPYMGRLPTHGKSSKGMQRPKVFTSRGSEPLLGSMKDAARDGKNRGGPLGSERATWLASPRGNSDDDLLLARGGLAIVSTLVAMHLVVQLRRRVRLDDSPCALVLDGERSPGHADVAHLAPVLAPRVADNPLHAVPGVRAPAHHGDDVVDAHALRLDDAGLVVEQRVRVDAAGDGAAAVDLLHHGLRPTDGAVVRDGDVRVDSQAGAGAALLGEAAAGAGDVLSLASAVDVRAEALLRIRGASEVGLRGLVGDACALFGDLLKPLVRAVDAASVAAAHTSAVQQMLHGGVDVHALRIASNLHAVCQGGDGAVDPARAAVLGDVLVPGLRAVALAVLVTPTEAVGHGLGSQEQVVGVRSVAAPDDAHGLGRLPAQQLALAALLWRG